MKPLPKCNFPVLLVDDDLNALELTRKLLLKAGFGSVHTISDSRETIPFLKENDVAIIILDLVMPYMGGLELLPHIHMDYPHMPVIVETASNDVETAVECMRNGAFDYIVKPIDGSRLISCLHKALNFDNLRQEVHALKDYLIKNHLEHAEAFAEIKTNSRRMRALFQYAEIIAKSSQPALITGETGVGKEMLARSIHRISGVKGDLVTVNVAGLDDAMFSDTLFGHRKGAYTGADQFRDGLISKAAEGTLFLDEIGDLSGLSQVKLLRLLQEHEYYPVGSDSIKKSSARIIMATNQDLERLIKEGRFRRDLYYRLFTHHIHIPPLRERKEDIALLLTSFIEEASQHFNKCRPGVSPELLTALMGYDFPGNVRELHARVYDAVARNTDGALSLADFPGNFSGGSQSALSAHEHRTDISTGIYSVFGRLPTFREIEDYLLAEAMQAAGGSHAVTASLLGITRQTVTNRLKSKNQ